MSQYQNRMASGGSCYYPGERPLSSYAGGAIGLRGDTYGHGAPLYGRRPMYEAERPG